MSARLIMLVPTGEMVDTPGGLVQCVEPVEVQPLSDDQLEAMWEADRTSAEDCKSLYYFKVVARAVEAEHGIGRRLDA